MTRAEHMLTEGAARGLLDIEREPGARYLAALAELPRAQWRRFQPAAQRAATVLDHLTPALLAVTAHGLLAGLFVQVARGQAVVLFASGEQHAWQAIPVREIPGAIHRAHKVAKEAGTTMVEMRRALPAAAAWVIEAGVVHDAVLGLLFDASPVPYGMIEHWSDQGLVPALVALVARGGGRAVALQRAAFPLGRAWPELELAEACGRA